MKGRAHVRLGGNTLIEFNRVVFRLSSASPVSARAVKQLRDFRGLDVVRLETDPSSRLASVDTTLAVNTMVGQYEHNTYAYA